MSRNLSISETGLRLIKAFEGYRPVDRELVTGARVVGYGHRVHDDTPRRLTREQAEETLRLDLRAYEEMVNEEVHAPLSQSQFDALCSLAFNIGPKAFRASDTVRALNNGRVLDAANGFDIWRKATIGGQTYVVDALMRRRTAEKSLFLRTEASVPATTALLEPQVDAAAADMTTDDGLPVFSEDMAAGVIAKAPYEASPNPLRRREDQPAGILTLSEVVEPDDVDAAFVETVEDDDVFDAPTEDADADATGEAEPKLSVIAQAADDLGDRLGALLDDGDAPTEATADWPQSLIQPAGDVPDDEPEATDNLVAFPGRTATIEDEAVIAAEPPRETIVIDEIAADDILRASREPDGPVYVASDAADDPEVEFVGGLWIPVVLGFALLGASVAAMLAGARELLGSWGPFMALAGAIIGAIMIVFSLYLATAGALRDE